MDQGGQECGEMDAPVVPLIRPQQGPTASLRPGLQPWELPSTAGPAARDQALDPDNDSGEIDQDRGKGRSPCPPGDLPAGRGGGAPEVIPCDPLCDQPPEAADAGSRMIDSLQPQYTAPDTVGVVSPWADDLVAFWSCVGQERR